MVAKISVGKSLYGALAYNGEKINEAKGRLLTTNRIYNDGTGTVDIRKAMEGFLACMRSIRGWRNRYSISRSIRIPTTC